MTDIFTRAELKRAAHIMAENELASPSKSPHGQLRELIVKPALKRIERATGQQNDPDYLAYMLEWRAGRR